MLAGVWLVSPAEIAEAPAGMQSRPQTREGQTTLSHTTVVAVVIGHMALWWQHVQKQSPQS